MGTNGKFFSLDFKHSISSLAINYCHSCIKVCLAVNNTVEPIHLIAGRNDKKKKNKENIFLFRSEFPVRGGFKN